MGSCQHYANTGRCEWPDNWCGCHSDGTHACHGVQGCCAWDRENLEPEFGGSGFAPAEIDHSPERPRAPVTQAGFEPCARPWPECMHNRDLIDRMRPVVEAARKLRPGYGDPKATSWSNNDLRRLVQAVDDYNAEADDA